MSLKVDESRSTKSCSFRLRQFYSVIQTKNLVHPVYLLGLRAVNNRRNPLSWQQLPE